MRRLSLPINKSSLSLTTSATKWKAEETDAPEGQPSDPDPSEPSSALSAPLLLLAAEDDGDVDWSRFVIS